MGGTINMIIRKPDGEIVPMLRWTNIMPETFGSDAFLDGRFDDWWPEFSKSWLEMRDDYERNSATGKYAYDMTEAYFPSVGHVPEGYGIVIVDWQSKRLLHWQGYCSIGAARPHDFDPRNGGRTVQDLLNQWDRGLIRNIVIPFMEPTRRESGRIPRIEHFDLDLTGVSRNLVPGFLKHLVEGPYPNHIDGRDLATSLQTDVPDRLWHWQAVLSSSKAPYHCTWTFDRYNEDAVGLAKLRIELDTLGIRVSDAEHRIWRREVTRVSTGRDDLRQAREILTRPRRCRHRRGGSSPRPFPKAPLSRRDSSRPAVAGVTSAKPILAPGRLREPKTSSIVLRRCPVQAIAV